MANPCDSFDANFEKQNCIMTTDASQIRWLKISVQNGCQREEFSCLGWQALWLRKISWGKIHDPQKSCISCKGAEGSNSLSTLFNNNLGLASGLVWDSYKERVSG